MSVDVLATRGGAADGVSALVRAGSLLFTASIEGSAADGGALGQCERVYENVCDLITQAGPVPPSPGWNISSTTRTGCPRGSSFGRSSSATRRRPRAPGYRAPCRLAAASARLRSRPRDRRRPNCSCPAATTGCRSWPLRSARARSYSCPGSPRCSHGRHRAFRIGSARLWPASAARCGRPGRPSSTSSGRTSLPWTSRLHSSFSTGRPSCGRRRSRRRRGSRFTSGPTRSQRLRSSPAGPAMTWLAPAPASRAPGYGDRSGDARRPSRPAATCSPGSGALL